jgi:alpha-L-fucosidase
VKRPLPAWFEDAKFGIFVHWTAATIPAFAPVGPDPFTLAAEHGMEHAFAHSPYVEWYQNSLAIDGSPVQRHHREHWGDTSYDEFVTRFRAALDGWNPGPWADLFAISGARYVVLVTKHHDGFLLWPSSHPNPHKADWQSERDVVGELAAAVRERGMRFGVYYSGGLDWTFGGLPITDVQSLFGAIPQGDAYLRYADAHWRELIDRYQPEVLWNDIGYPSAADLDGLFADFYERVPDGVVNNRFDFMGTAAGNVHADFLTPEYSTEAPPGGQKWETTRGIGTSFGFNREETDEDYLHPYEAVRLLVDVAARGGNLLLNVGPAADGTIPWHQAQRLFAIGWWLRASGAAIYGTRPFDGPAHTAGGTPLRWTTGGDAVFAVLLGTPSGAVVEIPGVELGRDATAEVLGHTALLPWEPVPGGVRVTLPVPPAEGPALALRFSPDTAVSRVSPATPPPGA